jgi:hypothetical protein
MTRATIAAFLFVVAGTASAGPTSRFGLTYGVSEPTLPEAHEVGPMLGLGWRFGPVVAEADYAYLSFLDDNTTSGGVHRLGGTVRADLWRDAEKPCIPHIACTRAMSFYGEAGLAERFGQWQLDSRTLAPLSGRQKEGHLGFGFEFDNEVVPYRMGWSIGVRFVAAPRDEMDFICRGSGCPTGTNNSNTDHSILVDVSWLVGA